MKRIYMTALLVLFAALLCAQTDYRSLPVAATDEALAPMVNPAALGYCESSGFGWLYTYLHQTENADSTWSSVDEFDKQYSLLFNVEGLSYVYERSHSNSFHRIATGGELFRNLYLGASWDWQERSFHVGEFGASALWRPHNAFSVGAVASFYRSHTLALDDNGDTVEKDDLYRAGIGVRPMAFFKPECSHRITLTTDVEYTDEEMSDPIVGLQMEPLNGLRLGGSYDVENETVGLNFRFAFDQSSTGAIAYTNADNELTHTIMYDYVSSKMFNSPVLKFGRKRFYEMKLKGQLVDRRSFLRIGPIKLMRGNQLNLHETIAKLRKLKNDPAIDGIVITKFAVTGSLADYQELAKAFNEFREAGKEVVYYFDNAGNMSYIFAANTGDAIYLNPMGSIDLRGMSISMPFVGELLDSLGVEIVNLQSHETKTAFNFLSMSEMPDSERESYELVFGDIYQQAVEMLQEGRGRKLTKTAEETINDGPYMQRDLIEQAGLVDGFIYRDQLEDTLEERYGKICMDDEYEMERRPLEWAKPRSPKIAVIYASGNIHMGKSEPGSSIGGVTVAKAIRNAREDSSVKGIVLRVDSGGGSGQASDIITREVLLTVGESDETKPLVVSMGGAAASGGYYISAYADHIVADPGCITGSIGVTGMLPNVAELLRKVRVNFETVRFGDHADIGSLWRSPTEDEREMMTAMIEEFYQEFIGHVARGRGMTVDEVDPIAQGRIWTGRQALEIGLVDELGGLDTAYDWMKNKLDVEHLTVVEFTGKEEKFDMKINADLPEGPFGMTYLPEEASAFVDTMKELMQYEGERILYRSAIGAAPEFK